MEQGRPRAVLDAVSDGVYVADRARKTLFWNRSAETILRILRAMDPGCRHL